MSKGIVNEKNKNKIVALFNALSDVLADDNMCCEKCEDCLYSHVITYDLYTCCIFDSIHYFLSKELHK